MRTEDQIREHITRLVIDEINRINFNNLKSEPENLLPKFIEDLANHLTELCLDEIAFGRK